MSAFALGPLFAPGYFWGAHDARHSVYFLFEFHRAIGDGILYPRWMPDFAFGYGYPFFNINGPLAYFVGELFVKLGLDFVDTTKVVFGLAIITSGWAMFGFVRRWLGERAALIAALVYVYAPYHLLDVYVRGALAETVALVFLPLCLWAFASAIERPRSATVVGAALAYVGLMLAHSGVALLFSLLLAAYMLVLVLAKIHRTQPLNQLTWGSSFPLVGHMIHVSVAPVAALLLGIGLSAVSLVPNLLEIAFVRTDQYTTGTAERAGYYDFHNHFTYFFQLFSPQWGFGLSVLGPGDTLSLQLGAAATVLALMSIFVVARRHHWQSSLVFFQVATLVLVCMMLPLSAILWEKLPLVAFAQFPWRFLALAALTMAPLAGSVLTEDGERKTEVSSAIPRPSSPVFRPTTLDLPTLLLASLVLLSSYPYTTAEIVEPTEGTVSFSGLMKFQRDAGELTGSTAWVRTIPTWGPLAEVYLKNNSPTTQVDYASLPATVVVDSRGHSSVHDEIWFRAESDSSISFNRFMYPGWHAYLLDREHGNAIQRLPVEPRGDLGLITVPVPQGEHFLLLRFEDTPPRIVGTWLTVVSALGVGAWTVWKIVKRLNVRTLERST
ncbi:MAG: 6-pyruvoyl-tetrahydropterin synthase-related protein [Chloroflexota bacterium]